MGFGVAAQTDSRGPADLNRVIDVISKETPCLCLSGYLPLTWRSHIVFNTDINTEVEESGMVRWSSAFLEDEVFAMSLIPRQW